MSFSASLFSATSPWNVPVPAGTPTTLPGLAGSYPIGIDAYESANTWTIPCFAATTSEPIVPLLYNASAYANVASGAWLRSGNTAAVEAAILASSAATFPYPGNVYSTTSATSWTLPASYNQALNPTPAPRLVFAPPFALPPVDTDGHMVVQQPNGAMLETYSTIVLSTGQIVALSYSLSDPTGAGDGYQNGQTASMLPSYAGLIGLGELEEGIAHAIAITVPPALLQAAVAYPAYAFDRNATTSSPPYSGPCPMGSRLIIPGGASAVAGLSLSTREGSAIAAAAATYGFIIVDRGGGGITLRMRPSALPIGVGAGAYSAIAADLKAIGAKLALAGVVV